MLITRKELDYYRNNDKEIEMHMEKLKRWQLILLRVENSYGIALRSVPEGTDVINEIKAILNATSAYLDRIGDLDKKIEVLLSSIQDSKIRTVMYHYYVLGETWDDIAAKIPVKYFAYASADKCAKQLAEDDMKIVTDQ